MPQPAARSIRSACTSGSLLPPHLKQLMLHVRASASVNGKTMEKAGAHARADSAFMAWSSVPFRSLKVIFVSTVSPSTGETAASGWRRVYLAVHLAAERMRDRRLMFLHAAICTGRGMRAQQQAFALRLAVLAGHEQRVRVSRAG